MMQYEFFRFLITGGVNTLFYYLLFSLFLYLGFDYRLAVLLATVVGVVFSFISFSKYVFNNNNKILIVRFIANYAVVYFLNIYLIGVFHKEWGVNLYWSGFAAMIPSVLLTYVFNKYFVFGQMKFSRYKER